MLTKTTSNETSGVTMLINPLSLRNSGHQPCVYVSHIQGTDTNEWQCPKCNTKYVCSAQAYCLNCMESVEDRCERISDAMERIRNRKEQIKEDEELIEALNKL